MEVTLLLWMGFESTTMAEVQTLRGLQHVLGMFFFSFCSQVFTSIFGLLGSQWQVVLPVEQTQFTEQVSHE